MAPSTTPFQKLGPSACRAILLRPQVPETECINPISLESSPTTQPPYAPAQINSEIESSLHSIKISEDVHPVATHRGREVSPAQGQAAFNHNIFRIVMGF